MIKKIFLLLITFIIINLITICCNINKLGCLNFNLDIINFLRYNLNSAQILPLVNIILYLTIIFVLFLIIFKLTKINYYKSIFVFLSIILLLGAIKFCVNYKVFYYLSHKLETSDFYEKNYIDARSINITCPKDKKNLILIFLESMEFTFADKSFFKENLIPELTQLSSENISFNRFINGYRQNNTQMALVAAMTGLPTSRFIRNNEAKNLNKYLSKIYSLGSFLKDNEYQSLYIQGSSTEFAGAKTFLITHGFNNIVDDKLITKKFGKFSDKWYTPDEYTIAILKEKILEFNKNKPFCAVMVTADTHCGEPHIPSDNKFFSNNKLNAIRNNSFIIGDFVKWVQKQSFAQNTVIVLVGDHLRMDDTHLKSKNDLFDNGYNNKRYIYNVFINSVYKDKQVNKDRTFSQIDLFPTILDAIGFKIEGSRLGLGTSLFSNKKTLLEELGEDELKSQLAKNNKLYNSFWQ